MSIPVVFNLFRAVAHFVEPPTFAPNFFRVPWSTLRASHISMAHFDDVDDGKVVGISVRTHGSGGDLQKRKNRSRHLEFMGAGQYSCSYASVFLNFIRLANPMLK